jgi:hypothetical protein
MQKSEYQPNEIIIRHCVFVDPMQRPTGLAWCLTLNTRTTAVAENCLSEPVSLQRLRDTQSAANGH